MSMRKKATMAVTSGVLALGAIAATAGSAHADNVPSGWFEMRRWVANTNLCLDIEGASTANGAHVVQLQCTGRRSQAWFREYDGNGRPRLRNANSLKCLDVPYGSKSPGVGLIQWDCNNGTNQVWNWAKATGDYNIASFTNANSGMAIDMPHDSTAAGTQVEQYYYNGNENQVWYMDQSPWY
ncbi:RICIN domain-containing protein [Yinghuangia seranimata]|uniref:RICIN domain-containing protein n=1 Tax=Yinghuangia seranimata TaxID=408067 RepID=UPI00248C1692|nr:RICIN domain-containing protein [Yinghuangia seranimata]MDI2132349.1 RICIN domain-containing protein [Yinghuangia seranimata]